MSRPARSGMPIAAGVAVADDAHEGRRAASALVGDALGARAPGAVAAERQRIGDAGGLDAGDALARGAGLRRNRRAVCSRVAYDLSGSTRTVTARDGRKPRSTSSTRTKLRISRPAPTSSTQAKAISETTSALRIQVRRPPVDPRLASFSASCSAASDDWNAGARPNTMPVTNGDRQREAERGRIGVDALEQRARSSRRGAPARACRRTRAAVRAPRRSARGRCPR